MSAYPNLSSANRIAVTNLEQLFAIFPRPLLNSTYTNFSGPSAQCTFWGAPPLVERSEIPLSGRWDRRLAVLGAPPTCPAFSGLRWVGQVSEWVPHRNGGFGVAAGLVPARRIASPINEVSSAPGCDLPPFYFSPSSIWTGCFCAPYPSEFAIPLPPFGVNLYPAPRMVWIYRGFAWSGSNILRNRSMKLSIVRDEGNA